MVSGPNDQIFKVSFLSHPKSSINFFPLTFGSDFGPTSPLSMTSDNPSYKGTATQYNLLCLFGDFDKQTYDDFSVTVSLYVTIGSVLTISMFVNSVSKSCKQISICNSPQPAIMCSPVSEVLH